MIRVSALAWIPPAQGEAPAEVAARRVGTETQAPDVVVWPAAEYVPAHQTQVDAKGAVHARAARFKPRGFDVAPRSQLEQFRQHREFESEARRIDRVLPGAIDHLGHEAF